MEKSNSGSSPCIERYIEFFDPRGEEILPFLVVRPSNEEMSLLCCYVVYHTPEEREISRNLWSWGAGREDGAWCTGWLIQGEPVVETLGEHGMRTRVTISIATHVGVSGAINKARARELRRRDSSLWRGWKSSRPMGLKRTIRSRPGSLLVCLWFRGETMTLALLLVPCSTTRVVLDSMFLSFFSFLVLLMKDCICGLRIIEMGLWYLCV